MKTASFDKLRRPKPEDVRGPGRPEINWERVVGTLNSYLIGHKWSKKKPEAIVPLWYIFPELFYDTDLGVLCSNGRENPDVDRVYLVSSVNKVIRELNNAGYYVTCNRDEHLLHIKHPETASRWNKFLRKHGWGYLT